MGIRRAVVVMFVRGLLVRGLLAAGLGSLGLGMGCAVDGGNVSGGGVAENKGSGADLYTKCEVAVEYETFAPQTMQRLVTDQELRNGDVYPFEERKLGVALGALFGINLNSLVAPQLHVRENVLDVVFRVPASLSDFAESEDGHMVMALRYPTQECAVEETCVGRRVTGQWSVLGFHHSGKTIKRVRSCASAIPAGVHDVEGDDSRLESFSDLSEAEVLNVAKVKDSLISSSEAHVYSGFVTLEEVAIGNNWMDASDRFKDLSFVKGLPFLKLLKVMGQPVEEVQALEGSNIETLDLRITWFRDLSTLPALPKLRSLNLWYNGIRSDQGNLRVLTQFPNLVDLDLGHNEITRLDDLAELSTLQRLSLYGNNQNRRGEPLDVTPLRKLTNLTFLDIRRSQVRSLTPMATTLGAGLKAGEVVEVLAGQLNDDKEAEFRTASDAFLEERFGALENRPIVDLEN